MQSPLVISLQNDFIGRYVAAIRSTLTSALPVNEQVNSVTSFWLVSKEMTVRSVSQSVYFHGVWNLVFSGLKLLNLIVPHTVPAAGRDCGPRCLLCPVSGWFPVGQRWGRTHGRWGFAGWVWGGSGPASRCWRVPDGTALDSGLEPSSSITVPGNGNLSFGLNIVLPFLA